MLNTEILSHRYMENLRKASSITTPKQTQVGWAEKGEKIYKNSEGTTSS